MTPGRLLTTFFREPQQLAPFDPRDPQAGYYNDLTAKAAEHVAPEAALGALSGLTADRRTANPVTIAQLGLGAWQLGRDDERWNVVADAAADWLVADLESGDRLAYLFRMPHTFVLEPPWYSSMANAEVVSLLVRAAPLRDPDVRLDAARAALEPLLDPSAGLIAATGEGPVLQEYPTTPAAHALNGWIFSLWGLHDAAALPGEPGRRAGAAFDEGVAALARRLHLYETGPGWSRYDLYPRRLVHAASPFYHRLHVAQLEATALLAPMHPQLAATAARWARAARSPLAVGYGVALKVAFRTLEPRRRR